MTDDILYIPAVSYRIVEGEPPVGEDEELVLPVDEKNLGHYFFTICHGDDVDAYSEAVFAELPLLGLNYSDFRESIMIANSKLSNAYQNRKIELKSGLESMGNSREGLEAAIKLYTADGTNHILRDYAKIVIKDAAEGFRNFAGLDLETTPGQYCLEKARELRDLIVNEEAG